MTGFNKQQLDKAHQAGYRELALEKLVAMNDQFYNASPYLRAPTVPSLYDDEFTDGSADLAERGWQFRNLTDGAVMKRVGDIDPFNLQGRYGALTANQYLSRLVGGQLLLQMAANLNPATKEYYIYKAVSIPAGSTNGAFLWSRLGGQNGGGYTNGVGVMLANASAGLPDPATTYRTTVYSSAPDSTNLGVLAPALANFTGVAGALPSTPDIHGLCTAGSFNRAFFLSSAGAYNWTNASSGGIASSSFKFMGVNINAYNAFPSSSLSFIHIDFIRFYSGAMAGKWILE